MAPILNILNARQPASASTSVPLTDRTWFLALVVVGGVLILLGSIIMGFFLHRIQARQARQAKVALARQNSMQLYHQASSVMSSSPTISCKPFALPPPPPPSHMPQSVRESDILVASLVSLPQQQQQQQQDNTHRRNRSRNFSLTSRKAPSDVERVVREQEVQRQQTLKKARQEAAQRIQAQLQNQQQQQKQQKQQQPPPLYMIRAPSLHDHPALAGSPIAELSSTRNSNQSLSSELKALEAGADAIPHSLVTSHPTPLSPAALPPAPAAQSLSEDSFHPSLVPSPLNLFLKPTRNSVSSDIVVAPSSPPLPRRSSRRGVSPTVPVFPAPHTAAAVPSSAPAPRHSRSVESLAAYRTHPRAAIHQPDRSHSVGAITRSRSLRDLHLQHMRSQSSKLPPGGWQLQVSTLDTTGTRPAAVPEDEAVASFAPDVSALDVSALEDDSDDDSDGAAAAADMEVSMLSDAADSPVLPRKSSRRRASGASSLYIAALTNGGTLPDSFKSASSAPELELAASLRRFPAVEPETTNQALPSYRPVTRAPMSLQLKSEAAAKRREAVQRRAASSTSRLSYVASAQRWSDELCGSRLDGPMGDMMPAR